MTGTNGSLQGKRRKMKSGGFSLIEVLIALAIALVVLTAAISLEVSSTALAARASMGLDTLPYAIERIEEVSRQEFSGTSQEFKDGYEIRTTQKDAEASMPLTQIEVEVLFNGESYTTLSLYKFRM
jgi:prepilin-type N-terminal cleavage/methylation domain-containing protein